MFALNPKFTRSSCTIRLPCQKIGTFRQNHAPYFLSRSSRSPQHFRNHGGVLRVKMALESKAEYKPKEMFPTSSSEDIEMVDVKATIRVRKAHRLVNCMGHEIVIELVSENVDPVTNSRKSVDFTLKRECYWPPKPLHRSNIALEYTVDFTVPNHFGHPGAVLVTNLQDHEFYLEEIIVQGFDEDPFHFPANTWIPKQKDCPGSRIIFRNKPYLPSNTPPGLKNLRNKELQNIRGDGTGLRQKHDRIYDYAVYNDLGNPDKNVELARPILGGEGMPYPRRCRTGRSPTKSDLLSESGADQPLKVYVPRDETFGKAKIDTFKIIKMKTALRALFPAITAALSKTETSFKHFSGIDNIYNDEMQEEEATAAAMNLSPSDFLKQVPGLVDSWLKHDIPDIIKRDRFGWMQDNEFGRQMLAGVNPVDIQILKEFPILSKLDPAVYGPSESAITKELIDRQIHEMSVEKAIEESRLFIVDYHDLLLPFVERVNSLPGRKMYASRTVFFYGQDGTLRPIAIELSLPQTYSMAQPKRVCTLGNDATTQWIWRLAKAHVWSSDAGLHQLANHWLRTHACVEPYIIATHRQLSAMHPIYRLLHPHLRYTLQINAFSRHRLINGGGIIEQCFTPGKYAMEMSSAAYKSSWRFDMEALPADLIRRGMAVEDPSMPCGVRLVIEDYPYAADGLLVWSAIEEWVEAYVQHFYTDRNSVMSDVELQCWWDEIKNIGHGDKRNQSWWAKLKHKEDLTSILTTIIWTASAQHAALNFGQYPIGGYLPHRPAVMRRLIPLENEPEYEELSRNPEKFFLTCLPSPFQATRLLGVLENLSTHSPDEEYLGKLDGHWIEDAHVLNLYNKFSKRMEEIEETINRRNKDPSLRNRQGAGIPRYELLFPSSGPGATARGIPNSSSI